MKLALENKIPINFSCEDGECGIGVVKVSSLDKKNQRMGGLLTGKEKIILKRPGKGTTEDLEKMIADDLPSK